jgi:hypothetical protein
VDFEEIRLALTSPEYRDNFYPGQDASRVKGRVMAAVDGEALVTLEGPGFPKREARLPQGGGEIDFDTTGFQDGTAVLTVFAGGAKKEFKVRKLAKTGHRTALGLINGMARHLERRRDRFGGLAVQGGALEDALRAVGYRVVGQEPRQGQFKEGFAVGLIGGWGCGRAGARPSRIGVIGTQRLIALAVPQDPKRLVAENTRERVAEMPFFVRIISVVRQDSAERDERFLDDVIGIQGRKPFVHECLHHRTVARDELVPADVLRILRDVAEERGRCGRYLCHRFCQPA